MVDLRWRFAPLSTNFVANAFSSQERRTAVEMVLEFENPDPPHSFGILFESGCEINPGNSPIKPASARSEIKCISEVGFRSNMVWAQTN